LEGNQSRAKKLLAEQVLGGISTGATTVELPKVGILKTEKFILKKNR
jgi:hypothetical protein